MRKERQPLDYEPIRRPGGRAAADDVIDWSSSTEDRRFSSTEDLKPSSTQARKVSATEDWKPNPTEDRKAIATEPESPPDTSAPPPSSTSMGIGPRRSGHVPSYIGLLLFTVVTYFRPQEFFPSLATVQLALFMALATLLVYLPSQLAIQGNVTERLREVNLLMLLTLLALLSIPFGISPPDALNAFWEFMKAIIIFIVIVNVVFTTRRLKGMFLIALAVTCTLAIGAINDYRLGNLSVEGYRVSGIITGGMFENPNDLGIHLAIMFPLLLSLALASRRIVMKVLYAVGTVLCLSASVVTFSRGNFLGIVAGALVLALKLRRRRRFLVVVSVVVGVLTFGSLTPPSYWIRVASIFDPSLDAFGSSSMRGELLKQSFLVTLRHPIIGVGIGNFTLMSARSLVSHNSYTQIGAEVGAFALLIYVMFIVAPLRRLKMIERETLTLKTPTDSWFYFLAVGLQASLVAYMVSSFFASVAFYFFVYYLVGYAVCLRHIYAESRVSHDGARERVNLNPVVAPSSVLKVGVRAPSTF